MISAKSASLIYQDHGREVYACREVDLRVEAGEFLGILGPSGSGKSSLLYMLSGLKTPTSGDIEFEGSSLIARSDAERSEIRQTQFGFVFQHPFLIGYLTALENVRLAGLGNDSEAKAEELLDALGLTEKMHRHPYELSGGERQRVCVARALLGDRKAIFADEPTAALDHRNGEMVINLLAEHRGIGSLVVVTHDPTMLAGADRIVTMADGEIISA